MGICELRSLYAFSALHDWISWLRDEDEKSAIRRASLCEKLKTMNMLGALHRPCFASEGWTMDDCLCLEDGYCGFICTVDTRVSVSKLSSEALAAAACVRRAGAQLLAASDEEIGL
jgi:hypothetical protein